MNDYECWAKCKRDKRGPGDCDDYRKCICKRDFPRKVLNKDNDVKKW